MLFLSNFIFILVPLIAEFYYPLFVSLSRDILRIPLLEFVEESRIVTEEFKAWPSGLKMACKISPNSAGI